MLCLGIETSCDETALALAEDGKITNEVLASQARLHSLFGGVVPELASREHLRFIGALFDDLMISSGKKPTEIDAIAVARGPGLLGSLLVGGSFAKGLALGLDISVIGVNHLHAHLLACGIEQKLDYPALGLVASGGHTHLYRIEAPENFILLGRSLDDACGEAFDKCGNLLGFAYPAGKAMDECANGGDPAKFPLPEPYLDNDNLDFSFSGLKTAASEAMARHGLLDAARHSPLPAKVHDFCAAFNHAVANVLVEKTARALRDHTDIKALLLAGGVAANSLARRRLRELADKIGIRFLTPSLKYCTDNAAMIAHAGWLLASEGFMHDLDFTIVPRGRHIPDDMARSEGFHNGNTPAMSLGAMRKRHPA